MARNTRLAVIAGALTVVVVGLVLYMARNTLPKPFRGRAASRKQDPALAEALSAQKEGRHTAALEAARRAANSPDASTRQAARLIEAAAQTALEDPGAAALWAAIANDTAFSLEDRAQAAVQLGHLKMRATRPDLAGAITAYQHAIEHAAGSPWGDRGAVSLADAHIQNRQPELAKDALTAYVVKAKDPDLVHAKIGDVNMAILFSPLVTEVPKCVKYTVESGDSLAKIAKNFNTTVDLLQESNRIRDPHLLQIGDRLKVVTDTFRIVIDRSDNTLSLFCHDTLMKRYRTGTGEYDKTPLGEFAIVSKDIDPPWKGIPFGDPRNVLGTRWMKITDEERTLSGYGIHGTWEPETIGIHVSQGCVRMLNEDVEQLFKIVSLGTPVSIVE